MKKIFYLICILGLPVFVFIHSCKDEDNYDWNSVEPGIQRISNADADTTKIKLDSLKGDMISFSNFKAIPRGGSTYAWTSSNEYLKLTENTNEPYLIKIMADSKVDTISWLKVQEITHGGKLGIPDSLKVIITGYCVYNIEQLLGNGLFSSKMTSYAPYYVSIAKIGGDTIVNNNFFNMKWSLKYVLSKDNNEIITIVPGQRYVYNEETVVVKGSGTYNTCKGRFEIKYAVTHIAGDTIQFGSGTDVITRR